MDVIVTMAIAALFFCLTERRSGSMAVCARNLLMRAIKRKIREQMVERCGLELNCLRVAALMFLVA